MPIKKLIIGIDIDGVIRNFSEGLRRAYLEEYPDHDVPEEPEEWGLHQHYPIGEKIYEFCWNTHVVECLGDAPPYDGYWKFLEDICLADDREVYLITTQPTGGARRHTFEWINEHVPCDIIDGILMISGGGEINKGSLNGLHILIDDYIGNLNSLPKSVIPICVARPWNKDWNGHRYDLDRIPDVVDTIEIAFRESVKL